MGGFGCVGGGVICEVSVKVGRGVVGNTYSGRCHVYLHRRNITLVLLFLFKCILLLWTCIWDV